MLRKGDKIGLVCCSDGHTDGRRKTNEALDGVLREMGLLPVWSPYLYAKTSVFSASGRERSEIVNEFYRRDDIRAIFDLSGGNVGNHVLEYLDYGLIKTHPKIFFGYSDLTTVLNSLLKKAAVPVCLYQLRNLVLQDGPIQQARFRETLLEGGNSLFDAKFTFLRGASLSGTVIGGNVRCLLKLAGTPYFPDCHNKVLFLESLGGDPGALSAMAVQLRQMGVFSQISGLLLGTFTKMEQDKLTPTAEELFLRATEPFALPVAKTTEIGHGTDSKALLLGRPITLTRSQEEVR
ncbi:MAG: LD-carboxypeptidase [Oscillospiraceae bacterium]|nr:LD-carboxypeptidase [Oscillospiraceae bacterium]